MLLCTVLLYNFRTLNGNIQHYINVSNLESTSGNGNLVFMVIKQILNNILCTIVTSSMLQYFQAYTILPNLLLHLCTASSLQIIFKKIKSKLGLQLIYAEQNSIPSNLEYPKLPRLYRTTNHNHNRK